MGRRRKKLTIHFAYEAVKQHLLATGYPERIAESVAGLVPSHTSRKFAGIDTELERAETVALKQLEEAIEHAEAAVMACECERDAERKLSALQKSAAAIRLRRVLGDDDD